MTRKREPRPCLTCKALTSRLLFCSQPCFRKRKQAQYLDYSIEISALYKEGLTRREVGRRMGISEHTVWRVSKRYGIYREKGWRKLKGRLCRVEGCGRPGSIAHSGSQRDWCKKHWRIYHSDLNRLLKRLRNNIPPERWRLNF